MENQEIEVYEFLLNTIKFNTTPEAVLRSLSSPLLSPMTFSTGDNEPFDIFLACIRFMVNKIPVVKEAHVEGIWEDFLKKAVGYSRMFSASQRDSINNYADGIESFHDQEQGFKFVPGNDFSIVFWLLSLLEECNICPNPYIRLEAFYLLGLFGYRVSMEKLPVTFVETLVEIQPQRLLPNGNEDDMLFSIDDLWMLIHACNCNGDLQLIISDDLMGQDTNGKATKFLVHFLQLIEIFAVAAGCKTDPEVKILEVRSCLGIFREGLGGLINIVYETDKWEQFCYNISCQPFRRHIDETLRAITVAVTRIIDTRARKLMMSLRDMLVSDLEVCNITDELPKLFMSDQLQGSSIANQQSLLLKEGRDEEYELPQGISTYMQYLYCVGRIDKYLKIQYAGYVDVQEDYYDIYYGID